MTAFVDAVRRVFSQKAVSVKGRYKDRAWAEIDLDNLTHNVCEIQKLMPKRCKLMAVVKANAYGHGDIEIARQLNRTGIDAFAVATVDEGIRLRKNGIKGEILVLGYTDPCRALELVRYRLCQTVADAGHAKALNDTGRHIGVHIKVDTGMHRLGEDAKNLESIAGIFQCPNLEIRGLYSHLCAAESKNPADTAFTLQQINRFYTLAGALGKRGINVPKLHIQSSYGVLRYPGICCDYARVGIALYGVQSFPEEQPAPPPDLRPVLSLRARVTLVRTVPKGETVGYGREFTALCDATIAVISIGYADGVPRCLSCGRGRVLIRGKSAPIIGRICMDQLMADVTGIPDVQRGDIATLIGRDGTAEIRAEEVAEKAGTITNELLSRLSSRLERIYSRTSETP